MTSFPDQKQLISTQNVNLHLSESVQGREVFHKLMNSGDIPPEDISPGEVPRNHVHVVVAELHENQLVKTDEKVKIIIKIKCHTKLKRN